MSSKLKAKSIILRVHVRPNGYRQIIEQIIAFENITLGEAIDRVKNMLSPIGKWEIKHIYINGYKLSQIPYFNQYFRKGKVKRE